MIIDGKKIGCPCYIDRPLYRYDKGCLIQSQAFTEQQTKEKPILRCDEIQNCPIKKLYNKLKNKEKECKKEKQLKEMYHTYYKAKHSDIKDEFFKLKQQLKNKGE